MAKQTSINIFFTTKDIKKSTPVVEKSTRITKKHYTPKYDPLIDLYDIGHQLKRGIINYEQACDLTADSWPHTTFKGESVQDDVFGTNCEDFNPDTIIFYNYKHDSYDVDESDSYNYYHEQKNLYIPVFSK